MNEEKRADGLCYEGSQIYRHSRQYICKDFLPKVLVRCCPPLQNDFEDKSENIKGLSEVEKSIKDSTVWVMTTLFYPSAILQVVIPWYISTSFNAKF